MLHRRQAISSSSSSSSSTALLHIVVADAKGESQRGQKSKRLIGVGRSTGFWIGATSCCCGGGRFRSVTKGVVESGNVTGAGGSTPFRRKRFGSFGAVNAPRPKLDCRGGSGGAGGGCAKMLGSTDGESAAKPEMKFGNGLVKSGCCKPDKSTSRNIPQKSFTSDE
ncbi:hypothetical protein T02_12024 [Trichinella nativa]|uniref:Uncharacterized protein n=1 Tax=Trichinella nativa TaxID=6335 RepID=A0A0V1LH87_9BILA|nr:hypothetical protein T02_12024 [Trichinella nativa]